MKITFSNLGTIKKTQLDLKPLTVIIGPNNVSKTLVAYSIYGLWQPREWLLFFLMELSPKKFPAKSDPIKIKMDPDITSTFSRMFQMWTEQFKSDLNVFFQDSGSGLFADTKFFIEATPAQLRDALESAALGSDRAHFDRARDELVIHRRPPQQKGPSIPPERSLWKVYEGTLSKAFPSPFLLPAERTALVITYKLLANRRFKLLREEHRNFLTRQQDIERLLDKEQLLLLRKELLLKEQGDIRYPKPVEDFLDFLTDIEFTLAKDNANKDPARRPFVELSNALEHSLQGPARIRLVSTALGGQEIKLDLNENLTIDLYNASSSIKQITPLLLYLRFRAKPGDFLIIDEPEMNLHPESQAKLLEALGILVNLGVHVLLTTHSPYFMAHLNNLVSGKIERPNTLKRQAKSLYLQDPRAFVSDNDVGVYEMKDNELRSLKDDDYGIRWDTLSDVSVELQQRFFEISERGRGKRGQK